MPCVYLPGPAPAVTVANIYSLLSLLDFFLHRVHVHLHDLLPPARFRKSLSCYLIRSLLSNSSCSALCVRFHDEIINVL